MKTLVLDITYALGLLSLVVVLFDSLPRAVRYVRRRRQARGGVYGVVVDRAGEVIGTYVDPFGDAGRVPRVHEADSPWVSPGPDGRGMAWEGFGITFEEARHSANKLRRRHLLLLGLLDDPEDLGDDDDIFAVPKPFQPLSDSDA